MSTTKEYQTIEQQCAINFRNSMNSTTVKHVVFLSGMTNESHLSKHLSSRKTVEDELQSGKYCLTTLRAGIIVGSGSASFEIIRDLVEKLPIMIAPKWLNTRCQPIGISDVLSLLAKTLLNPETYNKNFDIGGKDVLTYREMLLEFAHVRKLNRKIFTIPVMTPRLSSYWLYFVTATSFKLASNLVESMKNEVVCRDNKLAEKLNINPLSYKESLEKAFAKIESNNIYSSWKDPSISSGFKAQISDFIQVPQFGCFIDKRKNSCIEKQNCINKIWNIGGKTGWYYGNALWQLRGFLDKLVGGVGLRRGRTNTNSINAGDVLDFWRVLYADKEEGRLLLYAEMKLPGEAWLEFRLEENILIQTATFRPLGILGRLYWYSVLPFHSFIFKGMLRELTT